MKPGPARVLDVLRRAGGRSCSGASLSTELGRTRARLARKAGCPSAKLSMARCSRTPAATPADRVAGTGPLMKSPISPPAR